VRVGPRPAEVQDEFHAPCCVSDRRGNELTSSMKSKSQLGMLLGDPRPRVAQRDGAVEDERARTRIGIDAEVAETLELHAQPWRGGRQARLRQRLAQRLERAWIQMIEEGLAFRRRFRIFDRE